MPRCHASQQHSPLETPAFDHGPLTKTGPQFVHGRLGGLFTRQGHIGKITMVGLRSRMQIGEANADQPVRFFRFQSQSLPRGSKNTAGQLRRLMQCFGAGMQFEIGTA